MAKPRFFVDRTVRFSVTITGSDAHHIRDVIRLNPGEVIEIVDNGGNVSDVEITGIEQGEVTGKVLKTLNPRTDLPQVYLFQALTKSGKFDDIIRMTTEIGVDGIYPIITQRTVAKVETDKAEKKLERWQKIAVEASKQSHRTVVPQVSRVLTWSESLDTLKGFDSVLLFWEEETEILPFEVLKSSKKIAVVIGPEGGFSEKEASDLKEIGANAVTMGESILRVETAAPVAVALVLYDLRRTKRLHHLDAVIKNED